jgi:dihydroorotate dehydrogenase electron transfer subunit
LAEALLPATGILCAGTLLARQEVARGIHVMEFGLQTSQRVSPPVPRPGQFYQVKCADSPEHILRRPLSAHGADATDGEVRVRFLVEVVGWGTGRLSGLAQGERVSVLGPLGNGFTIGRGRGRHLIVAGGIGVAPLYFLAREMERSAVEYDLLAGFDRGDRRFTPLAQVPCQVSLDARMACGIGVCRGCVKEQTGGGSLCVCADGPVFDSREVLWRDKQAYQ